MVKVCAGFWALVAGTLAGFQILTVRSSLADLDLDVGLPVLVAAQDTSTTPPVSASTFWHEETETQFSVNVANDSSDVFIYFSSPAYSWVGFGFGERMENSLMFIMYSNDKGDSTLPSTKQNHPRSNTPLNRHNPIPSSWLPRFRTNIHSHHHPRHPPWHLNQRLPLHPCRPLFQLSRLAQRLPRRHHPRPALHLRLRPTKQPLLLVALR